MRVKHSALNERLGVRSLASMGSPPGPASALRLPLSPPSQDHGLGTGLCPSLWLCCPLVVAGFSLQLQDSDSAVGWSRDRPAGTRIWGKRNQEWR